jgi:hypothetical protein
VVDPEVAHFVASAPYPHREANGGMVDFWFGPSTVAALVLFLHQVADPLVVGP